MRLILQHASTLLGGGEGAPQIFRQRNRAGTDKRYKEYWLSKESPSLARLKKRWND